MAGHQTRPSIQSARAEWRIGLDGRDEHGHDEGSHSWLALAPGVSPCYHSSMIGFLQRFFARRRLRPVVSRLPRYLVKAFGAGDHCTIGQARRAIAELRLPRAVEPYALAAVCQHAEIEKAGITMPAEIYQRLRAELESLFRLSRPDFTIADLMYVPHNPSDRPGENVYALSGGGGGSHQ